MGKVEIGIYCCLTADILTKVLQKRPLSNVWILSKPLNLIGYHGNRKDKFAKKKKKKIISSEALRGMKLKLYRNVHNINLYRNYVFYFCYSVMNFGCYGNFKFPLTCNGKNEKWHLLLSRCR